MKTLLEIKEIEAAANSLKVVIESYYEIWGTRSRNLEQVLFEMIVEIETLKSNLAKV
jgi:hypothetical protein